MNTKLISKMATALDTYKYHYGMGSKPDGAVILKHARNRGFMDNLAFKGISPQTLEEIGIHAFMTREEIIEILNKESEKEIPAISRSAIESILDFCEVSISESDEEDKDETKNELSGRKKRLTNRYNEIHHKVFSRIIDPFFDAVFRKIYTGSFFKKDKEK